MPILLDSRVPSGARLALVEGKDDQEFLKNWATFAGVTDATIIQLGTSWWNNDREPAGRSHRRRAAGAAITPGSQKTDQNMINLSEN